MKHDPIHSSTSYTFCSIIQVNSMMKQSPLALRMMTTEISLLNCLSDVALQYFRVLQGRGKTMVSASDTDFKMSNQP